MAAKFNGLFWRIKIKNKQYYDRYAVKLFISHVFEAMYFAEFHEEPPKAYVIQYMGHHDYIAPEVDYKKFIK